MLLAVDIGNSNVTTGLFRNGSLVGSRRAGTEPRHTADELEHLIEALLALDDASFGDVSAIATCSVVPTLTAALETIAERRERPLLVASAGTVPIAIRTDRPAEVGADRLVNALAAARIHGTPAIVADFGTATTLDCVAADGAFVGGLIDRARVELAELSGVGPSDVRVVLTGGLSAAPWARELDRDAIDPDLTLKGLAILHAEVGGGQPLELGLSG